MNADEAYALLIRDCLETGESIVTRNAPVRRIRSRLFTFEVTPLVSLRRTAWRNALREWEWFLTGSDNINDLHPAVRPWWMPWADANGVIWGNYGQQMRRWRDGDGGEFDQIAHLLAGLKEHPYSRRHVLTTWHASDMADARCKLTNCHNTSTSFFVDRQGCLHASTVQRSVDVVVGLPANWIQMAAFLLYLACRSDLMIGTLTWLGQDIHVYETHLDLARRIAEALPQAQRTPTLVYTPTADDFRADDFNLDGDYLPVLTERAEMVV